MPKIFISYRRADSSAVAGRLYDRLVAAFGRESIFKDVDNIDLGEHYAARLQQEIAKCDVVLIVIGSKWMTLTDGQGQRRIDDPGDPVRIEIEASLARAQNILIVPILVEGAHMPETHQMPDSLRELHYLNGTNIRNDPDFHRDVDKLIENIKARYPDAPKRAGWLIPAVVLAAVALVIVAALASGAGQALTPTSTPTRDSTQTPERATATSTPPAPVVRALRELPILSGPSASYPQIRLMQPDEVLDVRGISADGGWYQVLLPDGTTGWVVSGVSFVAFAGPQATLPIAAPPTATFTATFTASATQTASPTATPTATFTPTHTPSATASATATARPCEGAPATRLLPGMQAIVSDDDPRPLNLRMRPSTDSTRIGQIAVGTVLTILEGPICGESLAWYEVRDAEGRTGYVAEGDNEKYFIEPLGTE